MAPMDNRFLCPRSKYDADTLAFSLASGATDLHAVNNIVVYMKSQSLWDYARFYPMKSAQNAGTGSTVYGLGGLTSNNMTLVNSPTWGSDGVTFDGSTQHGDCGRLFYGGDITAIARLRYISVDDAPVTHFGQYSGSVNERAFAAGVAGQVAGDPMRLYRFPSGTSSPIEAYDSTGLAYPSITQRVVAVEWAGSSTSLWLDKESQSIVIAVGSQQSSTYNADQPVFLGAANDGGAAALHANIETAAFLFISGIDAAPTATQRETLTDLVNAL